MSKFYRVFFELVKCASRHPGTAKLYKNLSRKNIDFLLYNLTCCLIPLYSWEKRILVSVSLFLSIIALFSVWLSYTFSLCKPLENMTNALSSAKVPGFMLCLVEFLNWGRRQGALPLSTQTNHIVRHHEINFNLTWQFSPFNSLSWMAVRPCHSNQIEHNEVKIVYCECHVGFNILPAFIIHALLCWVLRNFEIPC